MDKNYGYKHTKGFLVFILVTIIMAIVAAYAQTSPNTPSGYSIDSQTGNLIPNGALTSITGWTSTTGSPTWTPYPSPQGSFDATNGYTFSFQREELGMAGVSLSNFNHGYLNSGAVFVTGFSYGLKYRFPCANTIGGYCEDPKGLQDNLRVEIGYYPVTGPSDFIVHQLGLKNINDGNPAYNPNWQQLAVTYTFAGAKPLSQAGAVNMGIIGQDAGNWACIMPTCYGPQVKDAYIKANYSVDPCILNPAFNPSCAGFQNILQGSKSPTFYYSYNIAQSLPHIGGGVILHGYDYGFNWYNYGACYNTFLFWCTDWRTDGGGNINFRISDKNNTTMLQQQWYVAGNNTGGGYSNRILFTESRNSLDMGSIQWWASDVWNHFGWVGWTRPVWTPDPCYTQPLYSPNCSNFQAEINRIVAENKTAQDKFLATTISTSSITTTPNSTITTTISEPNSTNPTVSVVTTPTVVSNNIISSPTIDTTNVSTFKPIVKIDNKNDNNVALSIIERNKERDKVNVQIAKQAVNDANIVANNSQKEALSVAENNQLIGKESSNNAMREAQLIADNEQKTNNNSSIFQLPTGPSFGFQAILPPQIFSFNQSQQSNVIVPTSQQTVVVESTLPQQYAPVVIAPPMTFSLPESKSVITQTQQEPIISTPLFANSNHVEATQNFMVNPTINQNQNIINATVNIPASVNVFQTESTNVLQMAMIQQNMELKNVLEEQSNSNNFLTNRANPLNEIVENRQSFGNNQTMSQSTSTINKNASDNELAGGVDINRIAVTPVGFNSYQLALRDVPFYAPKEIYRGQRTVDNARALRNLSSDKLHQEMMDLQNRR